MRKVRSPRSRSLRASVVSPARRARFTAARRAQPQASYIQRYYSGYDYHYTRHDAAVDFLVYGGGDLMVLGAQVAVEAGVEAGKAASRAAARAFKSSDDFVSGDDAAMAGAGAFRTGGGFGAVPPVAPNIATDAPGPVLDVAHSASEGVLDSMGELLSGAATVASEAASSAFEVAGAVAGSAAEVAGAVAGGAVEVAGAVVGGAAEVVGAVVGGIFDAL